MSIVNRIDEKRVPKHRITTIHANREVERLKDNFKDRNTGKNRFKNKNKSFSITLKLKKIILNHILDNIKEYAIVILIFLIGITMGVMFINNISEAQGNEIKEYINQFINAIKENHSIDTNSLLKNSLIEYFKLVVCMWFIGSTVIGMPIVLGIVLFRGFCIGYTVSATIAVLGTQKGIIFFLSTIFMQNIIFIPVLLALSVSGINLYKSIMKDKRKENIKLEIFRHTIYCLLFCVLLLLAALVETYISTNLLTTYIKYI